MSKIEKKISRVLQKPPRSDIEFDELKQVYEHYGFVMRDGKGSHKVFQHSLRRELIATVPIPHGGLKTLLPCYVKELQKKIEILEEK